LRLSACSFVKHLDTINGAARRQPVQALLNVVGFASSCCWHCLFAHSGHASLKIGSAFAGHCERFLRGAQSCAATVLLFVFVVRCLNTKAPQTVMMATWLIGLITFLVFAAISALLWYAVYSPCTRKRSQRYLDTLGPGLLYPEPIDMQRYAGKWYEVARLPNPFERDCVCSIAEYAMDDKDEGLLRVTNRCRRFDGSHSSAQGRARARNRDRTALSVSFAPQWLGTGAAGDYWILFVDNNYESALVGTPDRRYLWVLARSPSFVDERPQQFRQLTQKALKKGYDISKLQLNRCTLFD